VNGGGILTTLLQIAADTIAEDMACGRHATRTWPKVSEHSRTYNIAGGSFIDARPKAKKKKAHMYRKEEQMAIIRLVARKDEVQGYKRLREEEKHWACGC
jgi:hypothetical protein